MTSAKDQAQRLWKGPLLAWLTLVALFAVNLGSSCLPFGAGTLAINLIVAAAMIAVLQVFLMDLKNATQLVRVVAVSGLFWTVLMFVLTFNDYLSRTH
jgi:cytochrome c oxidase subunit IV